MKTAVKALLLKGLSTGPAYAMLRARALKSKPATILCYHTLRPDDQPLDAWVALRIGDFSKQITMLRERYDIVTLDDALAPTPNSARPRVALTFDDGELGMIAHLLPAIRDLDVPVCVYVATGHIESGKPFWFDRVMNALQAPETLRIALDGWGNWQIGPARGKARWAQISAVLETIKTAPTQDRDALADQVVAQAAPLGDGFTPLQPMSVAQLQELAAEPLVTIGAHSHGHELLDQIPLEDAKESIARSRDLLVKWTGQEIRHFAYPNGNYDSALMDALDKLGFVSATILEDRLVTADTPAHALPRIGVGRYDTLERLKLRMVGV